MHFSARMTFMRECILVRKYNSYENVFSCENNIHARITSCENNIFVRKWHAKMIFSHDSKFSRKIKNLEFSHKMLKQDNLS